MEPAKQDCKHGFHMSLGQELFPLHKTAPVCPSCGRNYSEENFAAACDGLKIDPSDVDNYQKMR